jgi:hypothetical protein
MPQNLIKAYSVKLKRKEPELEKVWDKAKAATIQNGIKEGSKNFYAYTVTVFKRMLGIENEDDKVMGLHDINNHPAYQVSETKVVPSFKDFILSEDSKENKSLLNNHVKASKALYIALDNLTNTAEALTDANLMDGHEWFNTVIKLKQELSKWNNQLHGYEEK